MTLNKMRLTSLFEFPERLSRQYTPSAINGCRTPAPLTTKPAPAPRDTRKKTPKSSPSRLTAANAGTIICVA